VEAAFFDGMLLTSQMLGCAQAKAATDLRRFTRINLNELISDLNLGVGGTVTRFRGNQGAKKIGASNGSKAATPNPVSQVLW
jgi:hypothetical protein